MRLRLISRKGALVTGLLALAIMPGAALAGYPTGGLSPAPRVGVAIPKIAPGDWPMYGHDVSRTNFNPDEHSISAGNVAQLTQAWQQSLGGGPSTSSVPAIANGRVFTGSGATTGNNFLTFDAVTGAPGWGANLSHTNSGGCFDVGVGSSPAVSGTFVSVGGEDPAYYGLDATTGAILWRDPMNVGSSGFPWASPLIANGRSYAGIASRCDNPSVRGEVRAHDIASGTPVASQYFVGPTERGGGIWNSPALSPDGTILAAATGEDYSCNPCTYTRSLVALDPISLAILGYNQRGNSSQDADYGTTPVIFHDNQNRVLVAATHKNGTTYAYVLNNLNAGPIWSKATGVSVGAMPAYDPTYGDGGTLFIVGSGGRIYAVDPATGTDRWPFVTAGTLHANIAIANGLIFCNTGAAGLKILDETNGQVLRTIVPPSAGTTNSGVAVSNGIIYWIAGGYLNAWGVGGTPQPTNTATVTPNATSTSTSTNTPTETATPAATSTGTITVVPATSTATATLPSETATPTPGVGSTTPVVTGTSVSTETATRTVTATATACAISFTDVQPTDYFYEPVRYLLCLGAISGYSDNTFRPFSDTTRGQLSKIVVLAEGWVINTQGGPHFTDVPSSNPFYAFIETAYNRGIISGYSDNTFRWGNNVTRGQLSKIVVLAEGWTLNTGGGPHFTDVPPTDPFYAFIETALNRTIISGYSDNTFRPGNSATRGQIAKIVYGAVTQP